MIKYLLLMLIALPASGAGIIISEVMFNPSDGNEWIEFFYYGEDELNLDGFEITDNLHRDQITCCQGGCALSVPPDTYFLIFDQDTTFPIPDGKYYFCVDDNAIGNGLGNTADQINLTIGNVSYAFFSYATTVKAGNTLSQINGVWHETPPTPWETNRLPNSVELTFALPELLYPGFEYKPMFQIASTDASRDITLYYNISGEYFEENTITATIISKASLGSVVFSRPGNYNICTHLITQGYETRICSEFSVVETALIDCSIDLSIETEKLIYEAGEKVNFRNRLSNTSFPFVIEYWIEDLFGETAKERIETTNTNLKSYTPKLEENEKAFIIKAYLSAACNNHGNNYAEKLFIVRADRIRENNISIEQIYPSSGKFSFGDIIRVKIKIEKNSTKDNAFKAYVEGESKVSEITHFNIWGSYRLYELAIPVMLKCSETYRDGTYSLVVEGLGQKAAEVIVIEGRPCAKKDNEPKAAEKLYSLLSYEIISDTLLLTLNMNNPDSIEHSYDVWSYLYRGNKACGDREANKQEITISQQGSSLLTLENSLLECNEEVYSLKIRILRDDRVTPYEITENGVKIEKKHTVVPETIAEELTLEPLAAITQEAGESIPEHKPIAPTGHVVYSSPSYKLQNSMLFFVLAALALSLFVYFRRRQ
jgi:hypothetical protein